MKKNFNTSILVMSVISVALTFFSPLAIERFEGFFTSSKKIISLFCGLDSAACTTLTVIAGLCFLLFACLYCFVPSVRKAAHGFYASGAGLVVMQIISMLKALNHYDDSSLWVMMRSEMSDLSLHFMAVVTTIFTIVTILYFKRVSSITEE